MNFRRIKQARLKLGITQKELALRVGLSQAEVSRKENGITSMDVDDLKTFANALGVSIAYFLEGPKAKAVGE
ncbi:helix-turn-helix protein [Pelotomaculum sp. FP]|uniref:helix-turn-helix domain-containing protein n=1 Tax=Pelotomaculum sp. FP TaxID=261474 RepID=UPI0011034F4B|nr:helix-turn-helix transcriptional regulator [Pelotomaculum sp. FP]TEB15144.1 helix-turn-helix protein [Pelotomaculum sp. FP]